MQIGHTGFNRDVFVVDIFELASLLYLKKVFIVVPYQSVCINVP